MNEEFYKSWKWKKKRETILKRDNYECQLCKNSGKVAKAKIVHHIAHYDTYPELGLTDSNLLSVCFS